MSKIKSTLLWLLALVITLASAVYQRATGPSHPVTGEVLIANISYEYELIRSHGGAGDAPIIIEVPAPITGNIYYKRYKGEDQAQKIAMIREEDRLLAYLPHQAPAGKLEYTVCLNDGHQDYQLNQNPVVIRFKGAVPAGVLIPHILLMFMAMLLSTRTGIEALVRGSKTLKYTIATLFTLFLGGLILGPVVQHYAFGAYWTGWPFGSDWTDNKTILAFIFWMIAYIYLRKHPQGRLWPVVATLILWLVYMIPHSMGGSELNPSTGEITTGLKD